MDLSFVCYKAFLCCHNVFLVTHIILAICKPRHWNLDIGIGIGNGIGIGTDITNAIISSSIRSMDPKLSRVVT